MTMKDQFSLQISRHGTEIVLSLLFISAILLFIAGYVLVTPPTEPGSTDTLDEHRFEASVEDSIIVTKNNTLWPIDDKLVSQEIYFIEASETLLLNGTLTLPDDRPVTVTFSYVIETTIERNDQLLWKETKSLVDVEEQSVTNGTVYLNQSANIPELTEELDDINDIVSSSASVSQSVILNVDYQTEAAMDEQYEGTLEVDRELLTSEETYHVEGDKVNSNVERVVRENEPITQDPDYELITLLLIAGAAIGGLGAGVSLYRRRIPPTSVLNYRVEKSSYSERISAGKIEHSPHAIYIELNTFNGIVNTAIDHDSRVIHDFEKRVYVSYDWPVIFIFFEPGEHDKLQ